MTTGTLSPSSTKKIDHFKLFREAQLEPPRRPFIAKARNLFTTLRQLDVDLRRLGLGGLEKIDASDEPDYLSMSPREIQDFCTSLEALVGECRADLRAHYDAEDARRRAAQTPEQRRLAELEAEVAELKSRQLNMASAAAREDPNVPPMPFISGVNTLAPPMSYGVTPAGAPPRNARPGGAVARRVGGSAYNGTASQPAARGEPLPMANMTPSISGSQLAGASGPEILGAIFTKPER